MTGVTTEAPKAETILSKVENQDTQLAKMEGMAINLLSKIFGPTPSDTGELTNPEILPIETRLDRNSQTMVRIRSILEELNERV